LISPLQAAENLHLSVDYVLGSGISSAENTTAAIEAANSADVILFMGGIDNSLEAEELDRDNISWPVAQLDLLRQLTALEKPTVVVHFGCGQIDDSELLANSFVNAVLWAGYPGQAGGAEVFDILTGRAAPAGRLPITQYPASYSDAVPLTDMKTRPTSGNSNLGRTHVWYTEQPVVPFGHGLHYTSFSVSISNQTVASYSIESLVFQGSDWIQNLASVVLTIPIIVSNTGTVESVYVAMLFLNTTVGPAPHPHKTLASYKRVHNIATGGTTQVALPVRLESLTRVGLDGGRTLYPGEDQFFVDIDKKASFEIVLTGAETVVEVFPQPS